MEIKDFLRRDDIQQALLENDLDKVYKSIYYTKSVAKLTEFLLKNNIDPLDYVNEIFPGMYYGLPIKDIKIKDTIEDVGDFAFAGCSELKTVDIPRSISSIGDYAFMYCTSIEKVNIHDLSVWCQIYFENSNSNPTYYAEKLYLNDELITELVIPNGLNYISEHAFQNCMNIESVRIPKSIKTINKCAFDGCWNLKNVYYEGTKEDYENLEIDNFNERLTDATWHFKE